MRIFSSPATHFHPVRTLILAAFVLALASVASAADVVVSLTGYGVTELQAAPSGESLVSFDWDSAGALYYMTGDPNWGLKLNVYRNLNGNETAIYQSASVFPGSRVTAVGPFVYFNDGGDYGRYTFSYFSYDSVHGGAPTLSYDSSVQPLSLWGIDTGNGSQFFASGAVGFGPSSIFYSPAPANGILSNLVNLGQVGESSGPVALDAAGDLFYAHGYVSSGPAKIFRWTAAELAGAIGNPVLAPLNPANHEWASLPATFTGANGMVIDSSGNVFVAANAYGSPGELLLYRPGVPGSSPTPAPLASYSGALETLRLRGGSLYMCCGAGIFQMPLPLSVSLAGDAQVHAVAGKPLSLSVDASGGEGAMSYHWFLTGSGKADLPLGNNSPTLSIVPALGDNGKGYYCTVTDAGTTVTSPTYTLAVVVATPAASTFTLVLIAMGMSLLGVLRIWQRGARLVSPLQGSGNGK